MFPYCRYANVQRLGKRLDIPLAEGPIALIAVQTISQGKDVHDLVSVNREHTLGPQTMFPIRKREVSPPRSKATKGAGYRRVYSPLKSALDLSNETSVERMTYQRMGYRRN
jgi:hypothetical protein